MKKEDQNDRGDLSAKKSYHQPILRVYGDIQYLTETTMTMGLMSDTRGFNMDSRTH